MRVGDNKGRHIGFGFAGRRCLCWSNCECPHAGDNGKSTLNQTQTLTHLLAHIKTLKERLTALLGRET